MAKVIENTCTVVTNPVRLTYLHLDAPYAQDGSDKEFYSACLIIPKSDTETVDAIKTAIDYAVKNCQAFGGRKPAGLHSPLRDGDVDREGNDLYRDSWFINAKSKFKPQVIDKNKVQLTDPSDIYSGMWGKVILTFYGYSMSGNKGVGCSLGNIQKTKDDSELGGSRNSFNLFDDDSTSVAAGKDLPF